MKQQLDEAKKEAIHDKLTQLLNRRAFERQIRQEAERFFRYKNPFSLIILDVDDFKNINDTYGHQIGDRALVSIAQQLMASVRKSDSVYRFGGEEFSVILPNTQVDKARLVAEKIRQSVLETEFLVRQVDVEITLSGGISQIREGDTIEEFILRADKALYLAKREGKNQIKSQDDLAGADGNLFLC
jgi:diguanylate cyclase